MHSVFSNRDINLSTHRLLLLAVVRPTLEYMIVRVSSRNMGGEELLIIHEIKIQGHEDENLFFYKLSVSFIWKADLLGESSPPL